MKEILICGGGGHAKALIDVIEKEAKYTIVGIIDIKEKLGEKLLGYEYIGTDEELETLHKKYSYAVIGIGQIKSNEPRVALFAQLQKIGFTLPSIISPLSYVSEHAFVDEGTVVMHHALINANAKIGKNCIINSKALCEHDSIVEDHSHISTGVIINGGARVKANSFVGSGAVVVQGTIVSEFIKASTLCK